MASIEEKIESLVKNEIEKSGYSLYDVQYVKEGKDYFLRIFIDKKEGISIQDCEKVNDLINPILDKADYIKEQYFLEVSSPGVERILRKDEHLKQNIGNEIEIKLFKPENSKKEYTGILSDFDDENIILELENEQKNEQKNKQTSKQTDKQIKIQRKNISIMKLKYNW